jgi:hypothetical protein
VSVLQYDPRPAYIGDKKPEQIYGVHLKDVNVRWRVRNKTAEVIQLEELNPQP